MINPDSELRSPADDQSHSSEEASSNLIGHSIMAKADRGRQLVSPWVQRHLSASTGGQARGQKPTALTLSSTSSLLSRLQRSADKGRVWQPNVGSLNPHLVNNFTSKIVNRFSDSEARPEAQPGGGNLIDDTALTLAGTKGEAPAASPAQEQAQALPFTLDEVRRALDKGRSDQKQEPSAPVQRSMAAPAQPAASTPQRDSGLPFSMAEVRAALEKPHFTKAPASGQAATPVQRAAAEPGAPADRTLPPGRRGMRSRIEEITPASSKQPPGGGLSDPSTGQVENTPPASPPRLQRQAAEAQPAPEPAPPANSPDETTPPVTPTVVEVIPFPTRPRRERPTIIPAVQRQPAPDTATPDPSKPAKESASPAELPEPAKSAPAPARTAPAEASQAAEIPVQAGPEVGSESAVQRQPDPDLLLREPPASQAPTPAETGVAETSAQPGDHPGQLSTLASKTSEPAIQRQPDLEMPLKEPPASSTPEETASASPNQPAQETPVQLKREATAETSDSIQSSIAKAEAQNTPAIQRQPDLEMPLKEPPASSIQPAEEAPVQLKRETTVKPTADTPLPPAAKAEAQDTPVVQRQPEMEMPLKESPASSTPEETPVQLKREAAAKASDSTQSPAAKAEAQDTPVVQRQPELEMPLKEPPVSSTPEETASASSDSQLAQEAPVQLKRETATEASDSTQPSAAKAEAQNTPAIQRQPDLEMPLKEPPASSTPEETASASSIQPAQETPVQLKRETTAKTSNSAQSPAAKAEPQDTPVVQRQPDLEMPLREPAVSSTPEEATSASSDSQPAQETPVQLKRETATEASDSTQPSAAKAEPQNTPVVQRQPELEMPLKEPPVSSTPEETASASPAQPAQETPVQLKREAIVKPTADTPLPPAAKAETQDTPAIQRQPDLEMPLREPSSTAEEATSASSDSQPAQETPVQLKREATAETSDSTQSPAARDEAQNTPVVQRQPDLEMPLREPAVSPTPEETPVQLKRETATEASDSTQPSAAKAEAQDTPVVQRQPDLEMPLKESPVSSTPEETPVQLKREATARSTVDTPLPPATKAEAQDTPVVQRHPDLEMPLREPPVSSTSEETTSAFSSTQPAQEAPVQLKRETTAKTSDSTQSPAARAEAQDTPVVQRHPDLEMPLKEPPSTPAPVEEGIVEATKPDVTPEIPAPGRVRPVVQRQAEQAIDLPLRQTPGPAMTPSPESRPSEPDLNHDILARAKASSDLPLLKPLPAPRAHLAQAKPDRSMAVLPQARSEGTHREDPGTQAQSEAPAGVSARPASTPLPALPLATSRWTEAGQPVASEPLRRLPDASAAPAPIQRHPEPAAPSAEVISMIASPDIIQRAETETTAPPSGKSEAKSANSADLEKLARQILPEIKRMLARERDRWGR